MLTSAQKITIRSDAEKYLMDNGVDVVLRSRVSPPKLNRYKQLYVISTCMKALDLNATKAYYTSLQEEDIYRVMQKLIRGY